MRGDGSSSSPQGRESVTTSQTTLFLDKRPNRSPLGTFRNPVVYSKLRGPDRHFPWVTA